MDYKKSTRDAIFKYHQKQLNQGVTREPKVKYKRPERDTQKDVLKWANENHVNLHVIESSTWNGRTQSFGDSKASPGFSDLVGNTEQGLACYIELKAKDRRSTLSDKQRVFLEEKIAQSCFAVVVDSRKRLEQYWKGYWSLKTPEEKCHYLLECLPKKRKSNNNNDYLFKDE